MGNVHFFSLNIKDIDEILESIPYWNLKWHQLSRGAFRGQFKCATFDGIELYYLRLNQAIQLQGKAPPETIFFGIEISSQGRSIWRGLECSGQDVLISSDQEIDIKFPVGYEMFGVTVDKTLLLERAESQQRKLNQTDLKKILGKASLAALSAIRAYLHSSFTLLEQEQDTEKYADVEAITNDVISLLITIISSAEDYSAQVANSRCRAQLIKRLEHYMRTHLDQPLTIDQLCSVVGISERSLNNYFHELFDMSPMAYFKALRLNQVRAALKIADPVIDKVAPIAKRWGFQHMGYFSVDYKDMFGESPSETLGRISISAKMQS